MARVKIDTSIFSNSEKNIFQCQIPVRITDVNYGGHVGNDAMLSIIHEARLQFLKHHGYTEMNVAGAGLIMSDVAIEFKNELFYGDTLIASVAATEFSKIGFDIIYLLEKQQGTHQMPVAKAKTGMICFNYKEKKPLTVPEEALLRLSS